MPTVHHGQACAFFFLAEDSARLILQNCSSVNSLFLRFSCSAMVGTKAKNKYRKKRKGKPFAGRHRYAKSTTEGETSASPLDSPASTSQPQLENALTSKPPSASRRKLSRPESLQESNSEDEECTDQGYRLINIRKLASSISEAHVCNEGQNCCRFCAHVMLCYVML